VSIQTGKKTRSVVAYSAAHGVCELTARAVVLAMGCRERNRGNIGIPGTRPSGIFTAGLAQRLLNIEGYLPGKNIVIVGSGDIGLIMARRLTWVGCKVHCVVELLPHPSGLTRNIVQCLQDFGIPLHISHTVTNISGHDRVQSVDISPVENGVPVESKTFTVACDTVLLSVGLVPENELSRAAGVEINHDTGGPVVDHTLQTSVPGVFACGNVLHVHDLVDFVSDEGRRCGEHVVRYVRGVKPAAGPGNTPVRAGANLKYVVPNSFARDSDGRFFMRPLVVRDTADLAVRQGDTLVRRKKLRHLRPAEMISLELTDAEKEKIRPDAALEFSIT
jgi:pyruvate/2-oxoglutarate dehydrogenase complex dihydrolipoamide dehydrogenase (E3) component